MPHHVFRGTRRQSVTLMSRKEKFLNVDGQSQPKHLSSWPQPTNPHPGREMFSRSSKTECHFIVLIHGKRMHQVNAVLCHVPVKQLIKC